MIRHADTSSICTMAFTSVKKLALSSANFSMVTFAFVLALCLTKPILSNKYRLQCLVSTSGLPLQASNLLSLLHIIPAAADLALVPFTAPPASWIINKYFITFFSISSSRSGGRTIFLTGNVFTSMSLPARFLTFNLSVYAFLHPRTVLSLSEPSKSF